MCSMGMGKKRHLGGDLRKSMGRYVQSYGNDEAYAREKTRENIRDMGMSHRKTYSRRRDEEWEEHLDIRDICRMTSM